MTCLHFPKGRFFHLEIILGAGPLVYQRASLPAKPPPSLVLFSSFQSCFLLPLVHSLQGGKKSQPSVKVRSRWKHKWLTKEKRYGGCLRLACKPEDPSSILRTPRVQGENQLDLRPPTCVLCTHIHTCKQGNDCLRI